MWKHEILETIQKTRNDFSRIKIENHVKNICDALESILKEAPVFYFWRQRRFAPSCCQFAERRDDDVSVKTSLQCDGFRVYI